MDYAAILSTLQAGGSHAFGGTFGDVVAARHFSGWAMRNHGVAVTLGGETGTVATLAPAGAEERPIERGDVFTRPDGKVARVENVSGQCARVATRNAPRQIVRRLVGLSEIRTWARAPRSAWTTTAEGR